MRDLWVVCFALVLCACLVLGCQDHVCNCLGAFFAVVLAGYYSHCRAFAEDANADREALLEMKRRREDVEEQEERGPFGFARHIQAEAVGDEDDDD